MKSAALLNETFLFVLWISSTSPVIIGIINIIVYNKMLINNDKTWLMYIPCYPILNIVDLNVMF